MGNKTRQQHNVRDRAPVAAVTALGFPFHQVDRATEIFGANIPGYDAVLKAVPPEFRSHRSPWCEFAERLFFSGLSAEAKATLKYRANTREVTDAQWRYIRTWLGSWEPRHEDKEAVCAWLLSLMLTECPARK